ncbi:MAG: response regulator [Spirochaetia bacterium]|jgi:CheY-like chemotaxis protein|nr:response regulator [Spirochaetia bacterium]
MNNTEKEFEVTASGKNIMVVDDEEIVRDLTGEMLKRLGYTVISFGNALSALEYYRDNIHVVDLVILDMIMPRMGGREAFNKFKEMNPKVKVFILSGYCMDSENRDMLNEGISAFIQKPVSLSSLKMKLDKHFASCDINPDDYSQENINPDNITSGQDEKILEKKKSLPFIEGINTEKALDMLGGDTALYLKLVERVKTNYKGSSSVLIEKFNKEDYEWIYTFAHSIKSLAGNLGADKLFNDAESVEQSIRYDDKTRLKYLLPSLAQEIDNFINLLTPIEQEKTKNRENCFETGKKDSDADSSVEISGYLEELKKAIRVHSPKKVHSMIEVLKEKKISADSLLLLEKLQKEADVYKFKEAGAILSELEKLIDKM